MSITVVCPECDYSLRVKDALAGRKVECPECGERVRVPDDDELPRKRRSASDRGETETKPRKKKKRKKKPATNPVLWILAVLPWGIPILTIGGAIWAGLAAVLAAIGFAIVKSPWKTSTRAIVLVVYDVAIYAAFIPLWFMVIPGLLGDNFRPNPYGPAQTVRLSFQLPDPAAWPPLEKKFRALAEGQPVYCKSSRSHETQWVELAPITSHPKDFAARIDFGKVTAIHDHDRLIYLELDRK